MTQMTQPRTFETTDLHYAALLLALGIPLDDVIWEGKTAHFVFEPERDMKELLRQYASGALAVPAKDLFQSLAEVKRMLHTRYPQED